jgi:hypothetical protein
MPQIAGLDDVGLVEASTTTQRSRSCSAMSRKA